MVRFKIVSWPEVNDLMDIEGFDDNATLIIPNSNIGIEDCTYLVSKDWLMENR